jgi:hypothetical protein
MRALLGTAATFTNEERFEEEFGPGDEDEELSLPPVRILPRILLNFLFLLMSLRKSSARSHCSVICSSLVLLVLAENAAVTVVVKSNAVCYVMTAVLHVRNPVHYLTGCIRTVHVHYMYM